jgi:cytochrome c oxidase subunit 2
MTRLMQRPVPRWACAAAPVVVGLGLAACAPEPVTAEGREVKALYDLFMVAAAAVFVIVAGLIGWSVIRYRARPDDRATAQFHDNPRLEIVWWALPTVLVIYLFIVTAGVLAEVDERTEAPALTVTVTGFQWQWSFAYEGTDVVVSGGPDDPPRILLPVGRRIAFDLESPDVIHSLWVPEFLIKRDVVPGQTNRFEVTLEELGTYRGQCGEFCGLLHDEMLFSMEAVSPEAFETWLAAGGGS